MQDPDRTPEPFTFEQVLDAERRARQRLAAAHAATRVLASAAGVEEAVTEILAEVCRTLGFQWAAFWQPVACSPAWPSLVTPSSRSGG